MRKFGRPQIPWSPVWTTEPRYSSASIGIGTSEILLKVLSLSVFSSLTLVHLHDRTVSWLILLMLPILQNHVFGEMMLIRYSLGSSKFSLWFRFNYFKLVLFVNLWGSVSFYTVLDASRDSVVRMMIGIDLF